MEKNQQYRCSSLKYYQQRTTDFMFINYMLIINGIKCKFINYFFLILLQEVFLPLYFMGVLIVIKLVMPNPNFPAMRTPRGDAKLFEHFQLFKNHTVAVVPDSDNIRAFTEKMNDLWVEMNLDPNGHNLYFLFFENTEELMISYLKDPNSVPIAVIFDKDPMTEDLEYEIRTNPSYVVTPSTTELFASPAVCRESDSHWSQVFPIETGESCPVNQYFYSWFVAIQALLDFTKIKVGTS